MKQKYERPMAIFDEFASNQFIAACGEKYHGTTEGMNCVNKNHYSKNVNPSNTENNRYHTVGWGINKDNARTTVFTSGISDCKTVIGIGQPFSESSNPTSGYVYLFDNKSGAPIQYAQSEKRCFGAYVTQTTSGTTTNPFSA